jgi:hypothetical protein
MKLIDKDALVTEIERRKKYYENIQMIKPVYDSNIEDFNELLSFLNTLEVKEVDLNKYINKYFKGWYVDLTDQGNILHTPDGNAGLMSVKEVAKHFFELGMAVSNKAQKGEKV